MELLATFGAVVLSAVAFLFGKAFGESEKILVEKRRIYEEFLRRAPKPQDAYESVGAEFHMETAENVTTCYP